MTEQELSLCPFCGETEALKPVLLPTAPNTAEPWKCIRCMVCGAQGPIHKDGLQANEAWERRAHAKTQPPWLDLLIESGYCPDIKKEECHMCRYHVDDACRKACWMEYLKDAYGWEPVG